MRTLPLALTLTALTAACAPEAAPFASDLAPPSQTLDLTVTATSSPGGLVDLLVTGASPGDTVQIVRGVGGTGAGACPPRIGGACMDVQGPYRVVAGGTADGTGTWSDSLTLPAGAPVGVHALQAVVASGAASNLSQAESLEITSFCADDAYEDNDDLASATPATAPFSDGVSCDGDDDWYAISVPAGDSVAITVSFDDANDGDIDLGLDDATGAYLDGSGGTTDTEEVAWVNGTGADADVFLEVYTWSDVDGDGTDYAVDWTTTTPVLCAADVFEANDDAASATVVTAGTYTGLEVCDADDDWYSIDLLAGQELVIDVLFSDAEGDIDMTLYDAVQTYLTGSGSTSDNEQVTYTAAADETVLLEVRSYDGSGGVTADGGIYDLVVTIQ